MIKPPVSNRPQGGAQPLCLPDTDPRPLLTAKGWCPFCDQKTTFKAYDLWLRDHLVCGLCGSLPRQRALVAVLEQVAPGWRSAKIHESSPGDGSLKFARECADYTPTHYDPHIPFGTLSEEGGYRSEDLEAQTFADETFDLVITQDVFEHIFEPGRAIAEIARTLKPGGMHICTVPLVRNAQRSARRAKRSPDGEVMHLAPPEYHYNPIDPDGALVTIDWGFDISDYFDRNSGLNTTVFQIDDLTRGIRAQFNEVLVSRKPLIPSFDL